MFLANRGGLARRGGLALPTALDVPSRLWGALQGIPVNGLTKNKQRFIT